jgi:hypothetical protein
MARLRYVEESGRGNDDPEQEASSLSGKWLGGYELLANTASPLHAKQTCLEVELPRTFII